MLEFALVQAHQQQSGKAESDAAFAALAAAPVHWLPVAR